MSGSVNKVIIIGNLGRDPELRRTPAGNPVCSFSVATTERYTDKSGNRQEETEWHNIVTWNQQAENCSQYIFKGSKVYVEGKLVTRSWEADGQKHFKTEIKASQVVFLDPPSQGGGQQQQQGFNGGQQQGLGSDYPFEGGQQQGFNGGQQQQQQQQRQPQQQSFNGGQQQSFNGGQQQGFNGGQQQGFNGGQQQGFNGGSFNPEDELPF